MGVNARGWSTPREGNGRFVSFYFANYGSLAGRFWLREQQDGPSRGMKGGQSWVDHKIVTPFPVGQRARNVLTIDLAVGSCAEILGHVTPPSCPVVVNLRENQIQPRPITL